MAVIQHSEVEALAGLSARLGHNPLLVQAGTGNTSIKIDGMLWIKASGKWLARANIEPIFTCLDLLDVRRSFEQGCDVGDSGDGFGPDHLRPSIETTMHAVLPHRVVVHVHSVNTIAWAVREDAPKSLSDRLGGLDWQWIPYVPSGLPLAQSIQRATALRPHSSVFVLGNHGLVIGADSCEAAEWVLAEVERRLAVDPRPSPKHDSAMTSIIPGSSGWRFPDDDGVHALAADHISRRILSHGILYPCQAIFLGKAPPPVYHAANGSNGIRRVNGELDSHSAFMIVENRGVMVRANLAQAASEILTGLVHVVQRIPESTRIHYLATSELLKLESDGARYCVNT